MVVVPASGSQQLSYQLPPYVIAQPALSNTSTTVVNSYSPLVPPPPRLFFEEMPEKGVPGVDPRSPKWWLLLTIHGILEI
ncbi:uncharacterized protein FIBRA_05317 [Fibroporia radiculosa]|uniref:Uncharacterized protein n=1 Tax=Fibroporia radiculosa TaxID=599839 RepID=J4G929_9APHY|nr:uncharacterized protein FIBRA_05317 [Fibroporia radiculosa]CCM03193.1 predicted protein [Fibroporia radiculosa]